MCDSSHLVAGFRPDYNHVTAAHTLLPTYIPSTCIYTYFQHHTQLITQVWPILHKHTIESEVRKILHKDTVKCAVIVPYMTVSISHFSPSPQLYYSYNGFGDPLHYKSSQQQYLLHHMRHPILTAPFILMWAVPVMSYDRLLLAVMMPLYMAWASAISALDMMYVKRQFVNKWEQLLLHSK